MADEDELRNKISVILLPHLPASILDTLTKLTADDRWQVSETPSSHGVIFNVTDAQVIDDLIYRRKCLRPFIGCIQFVDAQWVVCDLRTNFIAIVVRANAINAAVISLISAGP
jgi:hypothetical protein